MEDQRLGTFEDDFEEESAILATGSDDHDGCSKVMLFIFIFYKEFLDRLSRRFAVSSFSFLPMRIGLSCGFLFWLLQGLKELYRTGGELVRTKSWLQEGRAFVDRPFRTE